MQNYIGEKQTLNNYMITYYAYLDIKDNRSTYRHGRRIFSIIIHSSSHAYTTKNAPWLLLADFLPLLEGGTSANKFMIS